MEFARKVTGWALPGLSCGCCGAVTFAEPPAGAHQGAVSYGPALNAAAVLLSCYGNVPPERAARLIGMLLGEQVSAGWVDKAAAGAPHVLITRTPDGRLTFLQAMASRRKPPSPPGSPPRSSGT